MDILAYIDIILVIFVAGSFSAWVRSSINNLNQSIEELKMEAREGRSNNSIEHGKVIEALNRINTDLAIHTEHHREITASLNRLADRK